MSTDLLFPAFSQFWNTFVFLSAQNWFNPVLDFVTVLLLLLAYGNSIKMLRSTNKVNEIQLLPILAVYFEGSNLNNQKIYLKNIGRGYAFDVIIEPYFHITLDLQTVDMIEFKLSGTNTIGPKEKIELEAIATRNGQPADIKDFMMYLLNPHEKFKDKKVVKLVSTFKNAEGVSYYSRFITGNDGLFIDPTKRLTIIARFVLWNNSIDQKLFFLKTKIVWKFIKPHISDGSNLNWFKRYLSHIFWGKKIT